MTFHVTHRSDYGEPLRRKSGEPVMFDDRDRAVQYLNGLPRPHEHGLLSRKAP